MSTYLTANYHTHTKRCKHAVGEDREYVEAAIKAGLTTLGFSDHVPVPGIPDDHTFNRVRMLLPETEGYVSSVLALKDEYKDDIDILLGFECEYIPRYFEAQMKLADEIGVDYLILGQHYTFAGEDCRFTGRPTEDPLQLTAYVDNCIEGMATGKFMYLCHPDLLPFEGDKALYDQEMTRLCRFAKEKDIPLEINLHGMAEERSYPCDDFFRIAKRVGNQVLVGIDAHDPEEIGNTERCDRAYGIAERCGLSLLNKNYEKISFSCRPIRQQIGG